MTINKNFELSNLPVTKKSRLLGDVIHKINNSLGGIAGFASLLDRDFEESDPRKDYTLRIQEHVQRVNDLAIDLMYYVQDTELEIAPVSLYAALVDNWTNYHQDNPQPKSMIQLSPSFQDPPQIQADFQKLNKLIMHTIHAATLISKKIESIFVQPGHKNNILIEFVLKLQNNDDVIDAIRSGEWYNIESTELRLSLAIIQKMTLLFKARFQFQFNCDKTLLIQLYLPAE